MSKWFIIFTLILIGCGKGPKGDAGAQGAAGLQGPQGPAGIDAQNPDYQVASIIDPCGDAPGIVDEVLLKLANGQILVSFSANSSGLNTRLAVLPAGTYATTDGSSCVFTINANGDVL